MLNKIIVQNQSRVSFISPEEIIYCQSDNYYTIINLLNGEKLIVCKSLSKFSEGLNAEIFIRTSQSYLVNTNFIRAIDKRTKHIELENQFVVPFTLSIKVLLNLIGYSSQFSPNTF